MTEDRYNFLMWDTECFHYHVLTDEEEEQGWHWCTDWDELLVGPEMPEWGCNIDECCCGHKKVKSE